MVRNESARARVVGRGGCHSATRKRKGVAGREHEMGRKNALSSAIASACQVLLEGSTGFQRVPRNTGPTNIPPLYVTKPRENGRPCRAALIRSADLAGSRDSDAVVVLKLVKRARTGARGCRSWHPCRLCASL